MKYRLLVPPPPQAPDPSNKIYWEFVCRIFIVRETSTVNFEKRRRRRNSERVQTKFEI